MTERSCGFESAVGTGTVATLVSRRDNYAVLRPTEPDERLVSVQAFLADATRV